MHTKTLSIRNISDKDIYLQILLSDNEKSYHDSSFRVVKNSALRIGPFLLFDPLFTKYNFIKNIRLIDVMTGRVFYNDLINEHAEHERLNSISVTVSETLHVQID